MQQTQPSDDIFGIFLESQQQRYILRCEGQTPVVADTHIMIGNIVVPMQWFQKKSFVSEKNAAIATTRYQAKIVL